MALPQLPAEHPMPGPRLVSCSVRRFRDALGSREHREGALQSQPCSLVQGAMEEQQGRQHRELSRGLHKLEGAVDDLRGAVEDKVGWLLKLMSC